MYCSSIDSSSLAPYPPSALSFYADMPRDQKPRNIVDALNGSEPVIFLPEQECRCSTSSSGAWHNCSEPPRSPMGRNGRHISLPPNESFGMVDCGAPNQALEIQVKRDQAIVDRSKSKIEGQGETNQPKPNVVFLEIDSVSRAYADRHFPRTRELLQRYRLRGNDIGGSNEDAGLHCGNQRWCSADFSAFSVFGGPNSIPNQVSYMSGCMVTTGPEHCTQTQAIFRNGTVVKLCVDESHDCHGFELKSSNRDMKVWCDAGYDNQYSRQQPGLK